MESIRSEDEQEVVAEDDPENRPASYWPTAGRIGDCIEAGAQWRRHRLVMLRNSLLRFAAGIPRSQKPSKCHGDWLRTERNQMSADDTENVVSCPFPQRIHKAHALRSPLLH
jgi:hypothetical protein